MRGGLGHLLVGGREDLFVKGAARRHTSGRGIWPFINLHNSFICPTSWSLEKGLLCLDPACQI